MFYIFANCPEKLSRSHCGLLVTYPEFIYEPPRRIPPLLQFSCAPCNIDKLILQEKKYDFLKIFSAESLCATLVESPRRFARNPPVRTLRAPEIDKFFSINRLFMRKIGFYTYNADMDK